MGLICLCSLPQFCTRFASDRTPELKYRTRFTSLSKAYIWAGCTILFRLLPNAMLTPAYKEGSETLPLQEAMVCR